MDDLREIFPSAKLVSALDCWRLELTVVLPLSSLSFAGILSPAQSLPSQGREDGTGVSDGDDEDDHDEDERVLLRWLAQPNRLTVFDFMS